jgi:hypothetical protein
MPLVDEYRYSYNVETRANARENAKTTRVFDEYVRVYDATRDETNAYIEYAIANARDERTRNEIRAIASNEYRTNDAKIARISKYV